MDCVERDGRLMGRLGYFAMLKEHKHVTGYAYVSDARGHSAVSGLTGGVDFWRGRILLVESAGTIYDLI